MTTALCDAYWLNLSRVLHITNGDCAASGMRDAGITDDILPWRDVLHVGPVQHHDSWEAFDQARINFLVASNLGNRTYVEQTFADRLSVMNQISQFDSIYLWFEHDLYDQLQLLQVLMWLTAEMQLHDRIHLIVTDLYLGSASADNFQELFRYSEPLQPQHLIDARSYWQAFIHPTPDLLNQMVASTMLPFMLPALKRLCAEYPSMANGLNQVQNIILKLLDTGCKASELFNLYQETEAARFMGDVVFAQVLEELVHCKKPLIKLEQGKSDDNIWQHRLSKTSAGSDVWQHQAHYLNLNGIDKWIGGVRISNNNLWCYDNDSQKFYLWGR